jgi:hypothetical protein
MLCPPESQAYGTKRQPCETNYFETFNRSNVTLVDIKSHPIEEIIPSGLRTSNAQYDFDVLIYATGFDAFTGAMFKIDITGEGGLPLKSYWSAGPRTLFGLAAHGFPNMFFITGPQSPSVLFNMPLGIEMHCDWIAQCITHMDTHGYACINANPDAEQQWIRHTKELADATLLPEATSWYLGANIPGKPRVFMVYLGGGKHYKDVISRCANNGASTPIGTQVPPPEPMAGGAESDANTAQSALTAARRRPSGNTADNATGGQRGASRPQQREQKHDVQNRNDPAQDRATFRPSALADTGSRARHHRILRGRPVQGRGQNHLFRPLPEKPPLRPDLQGSPELRESPDRDDHGQAGRREGYLQRGNAEEDLGHVPGCRPDSRHRS